MEILRRGSDDVLAGPQALRNCCFPVGTFTFRLR